MDKCSKCVVKDKSLCERCKDNPKYKDYPKVSHFSEYIPVCPQGYRDCVLDPAYIKCYSPEWYKELYGDLEPDEAAKLHCDVNDEYCYDDEDK